MRKIVSIILFPFEITAKGFYNLCLLLSRGFYFYFYSFFNLLSKVFKFKIFDKLKSLFKKFQNNPVSFLLLIVIFFGYIFFARYGYASKEIKVHVDDDDDTSVVENADSKDDDKIITNLFNKYGSYKPSDINFSKLKEINNETVGWIVVDGTNINYPIVLGNDNEYYLTHDFNKDFSIETAFGAISNLFTDKWFNSSNHRIIIYTEKRKYSYKIFSVYNIEPETNYLKILFDDDEYSDFLNNMKSRSEFDFDEELSNDDKIITLSTCNDDNSGRKVVHAKLVN